MRLLDLVRHRKWSSGSPAMFLWMPGTTFSITYEKTEKNRLIASPFRARKGLEETRLLEHGAPKLTLGLGPTAPQLFEDVTPLPPCILQLGVQPNSGWGLAKAQLPDQGFSASLRRSTAPPSSGMGYRVWATGLRF